MPDSSIGSLPLASSVADDALLVMEQQGAAMKLTGQMLKSYAKQGVELEFQDYLDEAKAAADSAAGAVSAVTEMTVSAHAGETATVEKTVRAGVVNLNFGLPRGERGEPGPEGPQGRQGPQGAPGTGLDILGHYGTENELRAAVTSPSVGDAYGVGVEAPYDIYVFDGVTLDWKNYGQLGGGSGGVLPENVVTSEGGAAIEIPAAFGNAPHIITITDEEEPPLTAEDIEYGEETVKDALDGLFTSVGDGKTLIASAVTDKGVATAPDATFQQMADNIEQISTGSDTQDATATPGDILAPKTAYTKSGKVEGIIPSLSAQTITPGTADKTIANGQYLAGTQTIKGDPNLTSSNIKKGVSLFGVAGALESSFAATLTVKADIGAVVTATCGDTSVEALSTTGTVVLELPIEGTWKVTAVRGVAQYNTATVVVSSQYSAELTAEVHIEYYVRGNSLNVGRRDLAATTIGNYALFGGGIHPHLSDYNADYSAVVDAYDTALTHTTTTALNTARVQLAATTIGNYALFGGGETGAYVAAIGTCVTDYSAAVDAYDTTLTRTTPTALSVARRELAATTIGNYALFGGGETGNSRSAAVDAYDTTLTRTTPTALSVARRELAATAIGNYALFGGGETGSSVAAVDAYDTTLTRTTLTALSKARRDIAATTAGNYALLGGGSGCSAVVDAYDLFLTRTTPTALSAGRTDLAATTIGKHALFGGGDIVSDYSAVVDVYDPYLTHTAPVALCTARAKLAATAIGNYALFGGGQVEYGDNGPNGAVDVYRYT